MTDKLNTKSILDLYLHLKDHINLHNFLFNYSDKSFNPTFNITIHGLKN